MAHNAAYTDPSVMRIRVKASKTDQLHKGIDLYIDRTGDTLCPMAAMLVFLAARGTAPGPLFRFSDIKPLSRPCLVQLVKPAVAAAGIPFNHSFRIGTATTLAARGIGNATIQMLGWWQSDSYRRYIQIPLQQL